MSRWYRAYEGTATDPKLGEVALVAECSRSVVIASWHCLLESAASTNDGGRFDTTARRIAVMLGEPISIIEKIMLEMAEMHMIEGDSLCAWKARQFESDSSTERSKKHRERKRNADATLHEPDATAPYTETEPEKKIEAKASRASGDAPEPEPDPIEGLKPEHLVEVWNDLARKIGRPSIRALTPSRRQAVKARINGHTIEEFQEVLGNVERSPFLRGERQWCGVTFDWITQSKNFQKVLEGNYNGKSA